MKNNNNFEFDVIIKERRNSVYAYIPDLCIIKQGVNVEEVYKDAIKERDDYLNSIQDSPFKIFNQNYQKKKDKNFLSKSLTQTFIKSLIISFVFMITIFFSSTFIVNKVSQISFMELIKDQVNKSINILDRQLINISEEERNARVDKLKLYVKEIKTYIDLIEKDKRE